MTQEEIIEDIENYLQGELPDFPEFEGRLGPHAFLRYIDTNPDCITEEFKHKFIAEIWPQVKKIWGLTKCRECESSSYLNGVSDFPEK